MSKINLSQYAENSTAIALPTGASLSYYREALQQYLFDNADIVDLTSDEVDEAVEVLEIYGGCENFYFWVDNA